MPAQSALFIGQKKERAEIVRLLNDPDCRLLTLVGPGGIGKTRLSLQVAVDLSPDFADGTVFVPLAPVGSADLLPSAIANALQISFFGAEEPHVQLMKYFRDREMLLILDNFEHLLDGAEFVSELLEAALCIKILATSRERLNLKEEWLFPLDGLPYPTELTTQAFEKYEAVQLFKQRARQIQPRFSLTDNAEAVQSICRQVEGMPLGIELAATWLRAMTCQQVSEKMTRNLDFLTTSLRNIPERHRSLRAVFEQSWNLLSEAEQQVFTRLSIFRGGFDLEAAEQIADASHTILANLVDKSLVRFNASTGRYDFHELLRQYAAEKLDAAQEVDAISRHHLEYFIKLADRAESNSFGSQQIIWADRLEVEIDNLRAALLMSFQSEAGLHLATSLGWFFKYRTYSNEGMTWLKRTLTANPVSVPFQRAKALQLTGILMSTVSDIQSARDLLENSLEIARLNNDDWNAAWSLSHLGALTSRDSDLSNSLLEESIYLFRLINDKEGLTQSLVRLSENVLLRKDVLRTSVLIDEAINLSNQVGDILLLGWTYTIKGRLAYQAGDYEQARIEYELSLSLFRQARNLDGVQEALLYLAESQRMLGQIESALSLLKEALILTKTHQHINFNLIDMFAIFASVARSQGWLDQAAHLLATAENADFTENGEIYSDIFPPYIDEIVIVRTQLGEAAFSKIWAAAKAMTRDEAIEYALECLRLTNSTKTLPSQLPVNQTLTEREIEILCLLSEGLNSREMAERLFLGVETIRWYLKIIYSKLGVHSRSEAIARAKKLNLLS